MTKIAKHNKVAGNCYTLNCTFKNDLRWSVQFACYLPTSFDPQFVSIAENSGDK